MNVFHRDVLLLPARASEQGNVIGSVRYIYSILHILTIVFPDTLSAHIPRRDLVIFSSWHARCVVINYH